MSAKLGSEEDEKALIMSLYLEGYDGFISLTKLCNLKLISSQLKKKLELNTDNIKEINCEVYDYIKSTLAIKTPALLLDEQHTLRNIHSPESKYKPILKKRRLNEFNQPFYSQDATVYSECTGLAEKDDFDSEVELIESSGFIDSPADILQSSRMATFQDLVEDSDGSILYSEIDTGIFE